MGKNEKELEALRDQERELQFEAFTDRDAWSLGSWLVDTARERGLAVTIDIVRHGHRLFHYAFDGTGPDNEIWIRRKAALVNRVGHSSFYIGRFLASQGKTVEEKYLIDEADYAPHGGCFPLIVRNVGPVGTIAVSGLAQEEDHALVVEAIRAHLSPS